MLTRINSILFFVTSLLFIIYPLCVYLGLHYGSIKSVALAFCVILALRFFILSFKTDQPSRAYLFYILGLVFLINIFAALFNSPTLFKLYPVICNFGFLILFTHSLFYTPIVEQIARIKNPAIGSRGIYYTRYVTQAWVVFFY